MNDQTQFDPGDGWRAVGYSESSPALVYYGTPGVDAREDGEPQSMWVREDPVSAFLRSLTPLTVDDLVRLAEASGLNAELRTALDGTEKPVPPLPTAPHTVIKVRWARELHNSLRPLVLVRLQDDWYEVGEVQPVNSEALAAQITGFEVLSEPRAVTAKAVLLRAWDEIQGDDALGGDVWDSFGGTAHEFGVES